VTLSARIRGFLENKIGYELIAGLLLAVVALMFLAWLAQEMAGGDTMRLDNQIRTAIHRHASPNLTAAMRVITQIGSPAALIGLGLLAGFLFLRAGERRAVILFAMTMLGASLLNFTLKRTFHRPRPVPFFDTPSPSSYSFPSGHALFAFCFYGVIASIIAARIRSRLFRGIVWSAAIGLIAVIGFSRIYLGVHYPTDVAAGYAAALIWVVAVAAADRLTGARNRDVRQNSTAGDSGAQ
jgi:undecaprenyl-diphosphatase